MDSGYYAACAGLVARTQALDIVANNLANVNTNGYRGQQPTFRSLLSRVAGGPNGVLNTAVNDFNVLGASRMDLTAGNLERTGNALDMAIEGSGFFEVQSSRGLLYTRNGNFRVSAKGELLTSQGDAVQGQQGGILLPAGAVSVSADGTLSSGGAVAGKIRLVEFPAGASLVPTGDGYYTIEGTPPSPASGASVRQGMIESSNVNPVMAMVNLIMVQRHAEMLQRALSMFHADLNRIAATELPRI